MTYRAEIDGLRALAVIPVILFHAGFELFSGGFIGVDIFFVISGYLITTIIINELDVNNLSVARFYERRARRILPALFFVMIICIPFAWLWMLPDPLENFGQSIVATVLFANNILLFITSGYWDLTSDFKPLLHTWSLAVEEQYYVVFPVFLIAVWRYGKTKVLWMIVILAASSLALSEWSWRNEPTANFYLAPTRSWELLAGSIAAFIDDKKLVKSSNVLSLLGFLAVLYSVFAFDEGTPFPSLYSLVPVVGVVLIVLFSDKDSMATKVLSNKAIVGVGLISYSAYLWHQPLLAFSKIYMVGEPGNLVNSIMVFTTLIIAYLTWRFVEKPFRNRRLFSTKLVLLVIIFSAVFLISFGYSAHKTNGFSSRVFEASVELSDMYIGYNERNFDFKFNEFKKNELKNVLVVGNSFGRDVVNILRETYDIYSMNLVYRDDFNDCSIFESDVGLRLLESSDVIFFASDYSVGSSSCVNRLIGHAEGAGSKLFFIGTKHFGFNLNWITRTSVGERSLLRNSVLGTVLSSDSAAQSYIPSENYVSIMVTLTNGDGVLVTDKQGRLLSGDRMHLTKYGAIYIGKYIFSNSSIDDAL